MPNDDERGGNPGPATDRYNEPVIDPTENVLQLVAAAIQRQDDLRAAAAEHMHELQAKESAHIHELMALRSEFAKEIRQAETARIDAIRAVDVGAVNRAAEVAATQATTLASQVATSAEAMRAQVAAAAAAAATALAAALEPVQKDIADLRRVQYEQAGQKASVTEGRVDRRGSAGTVFGVVGASIGVLSLIFTIVFTLTR